MSLPVTKYWFSFRGRRNRKSFIFAILLMILVTIVLVVGGSFGFNDEVFEFYVNKQAQNPMYDIEDLVWDMVGEFEISFILFFVLAIPATLVFYILDAQRLRDFNVSGWFALLPLVIHWLAIFSFAVEVFSWVFSITFLIALCVIPGTKGPNKYGDDPLQVTPPTTPLTPPLSGARTGT